MQITVEWNKKTAAVVLFLVLGAFFVLTGARALYQQKSATPLSAFGRETGAGGCVTGYVASYVTITVKNLGNGRRFGVSQTYLAGGREYDFYTVPVSDGQYAQLLIWRSETKERLEKLCRTGEAQEFCLAERWFMHLWSATKSGTKTQSRRMKGFIWRT